jgi:alpha-1,2-rhamnosyltransferase
VILENNQLILADLGQVLADKSRGAPANVSGRVHGFAQSAWRLLLQVLAFLLPFAPVQRFLLASPDQFGLAWFVRLPARALRLIPRPKRTAKRCGPISLDHYARCDGSVLVLLDSSWTIPIWSSVERFKQRGGMVVGVIYDLIPITHPHTSMPNLTVAFRKWLQEHVRHTDAFIGISRSTTDKFAQFVSTLSESETRRYRAAIDHFHLGSELDFAALEDAPRLDIKRIFEVARHNFLMVGSFEPRKNHSYVLDAFDTHWRRGGDAALVMIGRQAWKTEAFLERVTSHQQFNRRLFLVRDATDSELDHAYRTASALIMASEIEGFGLPIVEGFQRGLPVLCSDIAVFREIAEGKATFFDLSHSNQLAETITDFCHAHDVEQRKARQPQSWITWRDSTDQLCAAIMRALAKETAPTTLTGEP